MEYVELINEECEGCLNNELVMRSVWMTITISCCFYSLFLFDTLGDSVGVSGSYWVLIVMPIVPLVIYVGYRIVVAKCLNNKRLSVDNNNNNGRESILEVITIGNTIRKTEVIDKNSNRKSDLEIITIGSPLLKNDVFNQTNYYNYELKMNKV